MGVLTQPLGIGALMEEIEKRVAALETEVARLTMKETELRTCMYSLARVSQKTLLRAFDAELLQQFLITVAVKPGQQETLDALDLMKRELELRLALGYPKEE